MAVHDWTRVNPGTFHHFHMNWMTHLSDAMNAGLLPDGYYAIVEQHAGRAITDVLTLSEPESVRPRADGSRVIALAETPPKVRHKLVADEIARGLPRTLAIRHATGHRIVGLVEIVSPANKDRKESVDQFVQKSYSALEYDCHLLVIDLLPPGTFDANGMPAAIWDIHKSNDAQWPNDKPLTLASFVAKSPVESYVERVDIGDELPDMPLFLDSYLYVNAPLESSYQTAWRGMPSYWKNVLEA